MGWLRDKLDSVTPKVIYRISFISIFIVFIIFETFVYNGNNSGFHLESSSIIRVLIYVSVLVTAFLCRKRIQNYLVKSNSLNRLKWLFFIGYIVIALGCLFFYIYSNHLYGHHIERIGLGALIDFLLLTGICIFFLGDRTEINFLVIGLTMLLAFPFITQMLHAVDEYSHFTEAYNITLGHLFNIKAASVIPQSFNSIAFNTPFRDFYAQFQKAVNYGNTVSLDPSNIGYCPSGYPFVYYIPSVIGLLIGRILHFNIVSEFLMGRIFNWFFYVVFGYFILRLMPYGKNIMAVVMLGPYLALLSSTYSIDGIGVILVFFFIAYCFYLSETEKSIKIKEYVILAVTGLLIIAFKGAVYSPVLLFVFLISPKELFKKDKLIKVCKFLIPVLVAVAVIALALLLYYVLPVGMGDKRGGAVDEVLQFRNLIQHPIFTAYVFFKFIINNFLSMAWWQTSVEPYFFGKGSAVFFPLFILWIFTAVTDRNNRDKQFTRIALEKFFMFISFFVSLIWIAFYFYLAFSPVGSTNIMGVNCRYLFPVLPMGLLLFNSRNIKVNIKNYSQIISFCSVVILFVSEIVLIIK